MRPAAVASGSIFLVGFMGAGKSAVGRSLAGLLHRPFSDTDELVVRAAGCPIETIFRERGEGRFREIEWDVLREVAAETGGVIATGGGLFLGVTQRAAIRRSGASIWLDARFDVIASRLGESAMRPLWSGADALERRAMFERRRAAYALADGTVDASEGSVDEVARRVAAAWRSLSR
jgi:shikimate kinase